MQTSTPRERLFCGQWFCGAILLFAGAVRADDGAPLADSAERGDFASVLSLIQQGADVHRPQPDGSTALLWAAYHDHVAAAKRLIRAGADPNAATRYGATPLSQACLNGTADLVALLLDAGADANTAQPGGETPLMTASRTGRLAPVEALLKHGAKVNAREKNGQTALMWAAAEGHVEVVDALIAGGADYELTLNSGFNAYFFAVREGRTSVVQRLLEAGAGVNDVLRSKRSTGVGEGGTTALLLAVENGHFELAAALLAANADPNGRPSGFTPLHAMTWVRRPIRGDGNPPPIGSGNLTSLQLVERLVSAGADVNARLEHGTGGRGRVTTTGSTPFWMAARTGDVPLLRLLLKLGADRQIPNADGSPPLLAAAGVGALGDGDEAAATEAEAVATVRLLLELGADVNAVDGRGETAMHGAAYQSWPQVVKLLADSGADAALWNRPNEWGWTPLLIAEGHRPGNFRPAPATITAIRDAMLAAGVSPPNSNQNPG